MLIARISPGDDDPASIAELYRWLAGERDLQGRVRIVDRGPQDGELGGAFDVITVALGSGGVGAALAGSLTAWLQSRRSNIAVKVVVQGRSLEVDARNVAQVMPILTEVLRTTDESGTS